LTFLPLQIGRPLVRTPEFHDWVISCGFGDLATSEAHTTLAYSKTPVDWEKPAFAPRSDTVTSQGGQRFFEILDHGVLVLRFESQELKARWHELVQAGASWDYLDFKAHITLARGVSLISPELLPYHGAITFGPEYRKQAKAAEVVQNLLD
jgi:uncharacterized protein